MRTLIGQCTRTMESRLQAQNIQRAWYNSIVGRRHERLPPWPEYDDCLISNETSMYFGDLFYDDRMLSTALLQLFMKKNIVVVLVGAGGEGKTVLAKFLE